MPEMYLRESGFRYSAYAPFTKSKERIQKSKKTGNSGYVYQSLFSPLHGLWRF